MPGKGLPVALVRGAREAVAEFRKLESVCRVRSALAYDVDNPPAFTRGRSLALYDEALTQACEETGGHVTYDVASRMLEVRS